METNWEKESSNLDLGQFWEGEREKWCVSILNFRRLSYATKPHKRRGK